MLRDLQSWERSHSRVSSYEVPYAKGVCSCQKNAPGLQFFSHVGTATSILGAPIALDDSLVQSIKAPPPEAFESSGSPSGSFPGDEQEHDEYVPNEDDDSMKDGDEHSENATMESDEYSEGYSEGRFSMSRPYNPALREAVLQHLMAAAEAYASSHPSPHPVLKNLHFLVDHPTDHNCVAFPLVCTAPHTEILDVLASALLHRRVFSVFDPVVGFTFDRKSCKVQVLFAWLEKASGSDCVSVFFLRCFFLESYCSHFDPFSIL